MWKGTDVDLHMITTTDNPFSPVTQYDGWLTWDMQHYNSNALLARVVRTSSELSDYDQALAIELAIEEIVRENVSGVHTRVKMGTMDLPYDQELQSSAQGGDRAA
jgi:hypothetical protein